MSTFSKLTPFLVAGAFGEPFELTTRLRGLHVASPSKEDAPAERRLLAAPLSIDIDASIAASFSDVIAEQEKTSDKSWESLMTEATFYPFATKFVPVWVNATTRASTASANATAVFGGTTKPEGPYALTLPWDAEPELFTTTAPGKAPFNGELKTAGDKRAFDGVADYLLLGMARSLFQAPASTWRFYRRPPVGFGVVGFPYAAHLVSVELIGHLFVAPASKPFVMASPEHDAAVRAIPDVAFGAPIDFRADELRERGKLRHYRGIFWTTEPVDGFFLKFLPETAPSARSRFKQIFRIYRHLSALPVEGRPPAVQTAELLFGCLCLCVRMPFVRGRAPTEEEFISPHVLGHLADALAWLLQHQVLYVDVRLPNVVIEPDVTGSHATRVYLVDYDDAVVLPAAPTSRSDVRRVVAENKNVDWPDQLLEAVTSRFAD